MDETPVVTVFLRNDSEVCLLRRSEAVGSYAGRWGAVAGHAEGSPDAQALEEIREETGMDPETVTFVRRGERFAVDDPSLDTRWLVTPYLFDVDGRDVETNEETAEVEWVHPPAILRRETVPELWESYWRVAPTVATVRADDEHGSAYLSMRALDVLRDTAALAVEGERGDWTSLVATARALLDARPSMAAVRNRVNRVMATAIPERRPEAVEQAAMAAIDEALAADREASVAARSTVADEDVVTISRSGTVLRALITGDPDSVTVAESRPGGEGVDVAETLAEAGLDVALTTDANVPAAVEDATVCLFGADAVLPDGTVVNKVGSRSVALAAADADVPCYAVGANDKIATERRVDLPDGDPTGLYDGDVSLAVLNPTFEFVPARLLDGVVTEAGVLDPDRISALSTVHAAREAWQAALEE